MIVRNIRGLCKFFSFLILTLSFLRNYRFSFFHQPPNRMFHHCGGVFVRKVNLFASSILFLNVQILEQSLKVDLSQFASSIFSLPTRILFLTIQNIKKSFQILSVFNFNLTIFPNYTLGFFHERLNHNMFSHVKDSLFWKLFSWRLPKNFWWSKTSIAFLGIGFFRCSDAFFSLSKGLIFQWNFHSK